MKTPQSILGHVTHAYAVVICFLIVSCSTPPAQVGPDGFVVATQYYDQDGRGNMNDPRPVRQEQDKPKSAFASALGSAIEGAIGGVGALAQTQLAQNGSSRSSYNANTAAAQQLATASTQSSSSSNTRYNSGSSNQQASNGSSTQSASGGMLAPGSLSAVWAVPGMFARATFTAKTFEGGTVYVAPASFKKKGITIYINVEGTVSGFDARGNQHTEKFAASVYSYGPYTATDSRIVSGSWDFSRGIKLLKIDKVW